MKDMFVNYMNNTFPGLNLTLQDSEITFGTPKVYVQDESYWNNAYSVSGINNSFKPNTEVTVNITKSSYKGIVPSKIYYHRQDLKRIISKYFANVEEFLGHPTFQAANITIGTDGVTAFTNHFKTKFPVVNGSLAFAFKDDTASSAKYFTVKVKENSLLYVPESSLSIKAQGGSNLPWVTDFKQ